MGTQDVRLAELLCALSVSLDLAMAEAPEKSVRACLLATGLARRLGRPDEEVRDTYYATLLRHLGCTATSHEEAYLFGPGAAALRPLAERTDSSSRRESLALLTRAGQGTGLGRVRYLGRTVRSGAAGEQRLLTAICEVGSMLAADLGLGPGVVRAMTHNLARWDGAGTPRGLSGDDIAPATRIAEVATQAVIYADLGGPEAALDALRRRSGGWLDPALVAEFERSGPELLAEQAGVDVWQAAVDAEPAPQVCAPADRLDGVARTFAHFVDLSSPYLFGHSTGVAELAVAAGRELGLADDELRLLRRAALLHDLGRVAVPTAVWEREDGLGRADWEQVRLHPYRTERILVRSGVLAAAGRIAGMHHERQDGSGYPGQASGAEIGVPARLLAAADVYQALTQDRPHRPALTGKEAAEAVLAEVRAGRLDAECVRAVLTAAGQPGGRRISWPAGLSEREVEVLRLLARGHTNREIARLLVVSPRTAEHHVQHIYLKLGVTTRAAAALFAMRNGLFSPE